VSQLFINLRNTPENAGDSELGSFYGLFLTTCLVKKLYKATGYTSSEVKKTTLLDEGLKTRWEQLLRHISGQKKVKRP
jgi:hypothetical protein